MASLPYKSILQQIGRLIWCNLVCKEKDTIITTVEQVYNTSIQQQQQKEQKERQQQNVEEEPNNKNDSD